MPAENTLKKKPRSNLCIFSQKQGEKTEPRHRGSSISSPARSRSSSSFSAGSPPYEAPPTACREDCSLSWISGGRLGKTMLQKAPTEKNQPRPAALTVDLRPPNILSRAKLRLRSPATLLETLTLTDPDNVAGGGRPSGQLLLHEGAIQRSQGGLLSLGRL